MRLLSYVLVFTGLLILQILIVPFFSVLDIAPDVVLIGVMYLAMTAGVLPALVAALLSGLIRDAFSTHFLGAHMLALVISAFITGILFKEREKLNFQVQTAYFSIIMLIHHLIYYGPFSDQQETRAV